jgi:hypothetical protein
MPVPTSTSPAVVALLTLSNAALQRRILSAFKATGQGSMTRERLVQEIAKAEGVRHLRGAPRDQFRKNVNPAIGRLLSKSPPRLVRHGTTNSAVALPMGRPASHKSNRTLLLSAIRDRIVSIRFTCLECGRDNEVTDLDQKGWCDCLTSFHETRANVTR